MSKLTCNTISNTAGTHSFEVANIGGLGLTGETWVDETANRAAETLYTNNTGKPIVVLISAGNSTYNGILYIDDVIVYMGVGYECNIPSIIVPNGSTYLIAGSNYSIGKWFELK